VCVCVCVSMCITHPHTHTHTLTRNYTGGPIAAMPCCYYGKRQLTKDDVPYALKRSLGKALAADVDRTYRFRLQGLG